MSNAMTEGELAKVRDWAKKQLTDGSAQPWSTFLLTRLSDTIDALLVGMAATQGIDSRLHSGDEPPLRLVASNEPHGPKGDPTQAQGIEASEHVADDLLPPRMIGARVAEPVI
jgi:hypothetical protein